MDNSLDPLARDEHANLDPAVAAPMISELVGWTVTADDIRIVVAGMRNPATWGLGAYHLLDCPDCTDPNCEMHVLVARIEGMGPANGPED